ncbi:histidine kinase [Geothrix edaphica]|uniref:Histidine kinase n=2 Tax=Geothrix edaphica TaxID=2927976 RepID=A0ABQ5PTY7_9BACT|nr:histidine kinase [Geothrix edaphica]
MGPANPWVSAFPLAKNWRAIGACYSLWVILLLYDHWTSHRIGSGWWLASAFSSPLTHIGAFAFLAPLPWVLPRRLSTPWNFILGFVLSVVACELVAVLLPIIDGWFLAKGNVKFNLRKLVQLYTSLVGPAMMVVGGLVAARARSEELREASQAEAQIAKNRLLQSQIHPHVLFNALNGLAELVHKDPKAAEGAIRHLSDLLRRILVASEHVRLPLREERKIIADFLALEAIRLGSRLRVVWEWDEGLDSIELPPLLLQPLVENAIKHGIAPSIPGGDLVLRARAQEGAILLEVWNSGQPFPVHGSGNGIGVKNLRSRLALHFGNGARLSIGPSGTGTLACIRFEAIQVEFPHEVPEGPCS